MFLEPSDVLGLESSPKPPPSYSALSSSTIERRKSFTCYAPFMVNGAALIAHSRQLVQSDLNLNAVNGTAPGEYQSSRQPVHQSLKQSCHYPDPAQFNGSVDSYDEPRLDSQRGSMPCDSQPTPNPASAISAASRNEKTLTPGRRHRQRLAEEFASAATSTSHATAHNNSARRENGINRNFLKKKVVLDDHVKEWVTALDSIDVIFEYKDLYEKLVYQKCHCRGPAVDGIEDAMTNGYRDATVRGTDDTSDTDDDEQQIPPAPPADLGLQVSQL
ncbi:predicted protein [Sclerotinia sclerotiorum 1980 UF-70]|uniref:Uncharacterized protein n=2 Tax=Sclerotinia sclerotiorum (strain ATCC 18683 / 1980 / Ss-1) TaxID=665079 RepID=A7F0T7_SCLS1|nr:predicted protein [Sclerotinia sclerotiorum 1980 UF-70]APA13985.1 hypothetical protein sscle_12g087550 [Sclerotinia sclerotiorum 1980 UF-70]EDN95329.1 predicted protein [Sclerotinia sclerotiorum 1980 UF-70]